MVTDREALSLRRWNGSVELKLNGRLVVSATGGNRIFTEFEQDANSPSETCSANVKAEGQDAVLFLTRHTDLAVYSCCVYMGKPGYFTSMTDVTKIETSNVNGAF